MCDLHIRVCQRGNMVVFDKNEYDKDYRKKNYKEIRFWFKKNQLDIATEQAKINGYDSINAYAKALLEDAIAKNQGVGRDKS